MANPSEPALAAPSRRLVVRSRSALPSRRAALGGLLVTFATVGTWRCATPTETGPSTRYAVAATDLAPGATVEPEDLRWVPLDLPPSLADHGITRLDRWEGSVLVAPTAEGALLQQGALARPAGTGDRRELSIVVEREWAVGGTLVPGDRIDVVVTYGEGVTSRTDRVLSDAVVRTIDDHGDTSFGETAGQTITLAVPDPDLALAVTNAARAGTITVVRATGATPAEGTASYQPADPGGES